MHATCVYKSVVELRFSKVEILCMPVLLVSWLFKFCKFLWLIYIKETVNLYLKCENYSHLALTTVLSAE